MRLSRIPLLWLGLALLACASTPPPPSSIRFLDSDLFETQLHDALDHGHAEVVVELTGSEVTVNHVPERLDRWFHAVAQRYKGKLELVPDPDQPAGRGLVDLGVSLVMGSYKLVSDRIRYSVAKPYDATVYFAPASGAITRVVFKRRPASQQAGEDS